MSDRLDIALHTAPAIVVGGLMGFMAAFGLRSESPLAVVGWVALGLMTSLAFGYLWKSRELRQHGGVFSSPQSKKEAYWPMVASPVSFVVFTGVFYWVNL